MLNVFNHDDFDGDDENNIFQPKRQQTKKNGKEFFFFFDGDDLNNLFQSEQRQTTHKWGDEAGSSGKFGHIAFGSSSLSSIIIVI